MKFALTIDLPAYLVPIILDHAISKAHRLHELINLSPEKRPQYVETLALLAVHYAMSKASISTLVNTEKKSVQRVFSLTQETARQFAISTEAEMHRTSPKEIHLMASNEVSHLDILRVIAELTYAGIGADSLSLSKVGF